MNNVNNKGASNIKDFDNNLTYLVVDDDSQVIEIVTQILNTFGAQNVLIAGNAKEALRLIELDLVNFIISDWEMPGMNGLELKRKLRENDRWNRIPFIIITAPISHENLKIQEASLAGVDDYLIKPFRANVLKHKIEDVLWKRKQALQKAALVVEDDENVRSLIKQILETIHFSPVYEAADGNEGFQILKSKHAEIAIVISDWEMPNESGIEFLRKIRIDQTLSNTPFIMVTSQESFERTKLRKAIEAQVNQYLMKPFNVEELKKKIKEVRNHWVRSVEIQRHLDRADEFVSMGLLVEAKNLYQKILTLNPKSTDAYLGLVQCINTSTPPEERYEAASALIRNAIQCDPKTDRGYLAMAALLEAHKALGQAVGLLQTAIVQCPISDMLYYQLGKILIRLNRVEEGVTQLKKALEINPQLKEAQELIGKF